MEATDHQRWIPKRVLEPFLESSSTYQITRKSCNVVYREVQKITNTSKIVQVTKTQGFSQTIGQKECKNNWYKFERSSWGSQSGILIFEGHGTPPPRSPPLPWWKRGGYSKASLVFFALFLSYTLYYDGGTKWWTAHDKWRTDFNWSSLPDFNVNSSAVDLDARVIPKMSQESKIEICIGCSIIHR